MDAPTAPNPPSMPVDHDVMQRITQFLGLEALLLDSLRFDEWLVLLDDSIIYEIPMRLATRKDAPDEYPAGAFRMHDNLAMIRKRIERADTGENWAEDPPSRTVRNVGSVYVVAAEPEDQYLVHSALTLFRQRGLDRAFDWIAARRRDVIRIEEGGCKLVRRTILLPETILQTPNLGIFL